MIDVAVPAELPEYSWPADLMTVSQVAATVLLTPKTVRQHIRGGQLRAVRLHARGGYRVRREDAQAWVAAQSYGPSTTGGASTSSSPLAGGAGCWPARRSAGHRSKPHARTDSDERRRSKPRTKRRAGRRLKSSDAVRGPLKLRPTPRRPLRRFGRMLRR